LKISKTLGKPVQVVKQTGKQILAPAGKTNVYAIAGGVAVSPLIGYGYNKFFDFVMGFFPNLPTLAKTIAKVFLPLAPVPLVAKFNIPAGGVINGTLIGMFFTNVAIIIYEQITGKSVNKVFQSASNLEPATIEGAGSVSTWGTF
jgi:hypothetical protein